MSNKCKRIDQVCILKGSARMNKQEFTRRVLAVENKLYRISCGMLKNPQDRMDAV